MDSLENLRVLEGSEVFFRGLQHPDSPVQIRSAPLKNLKLICFRFFFWAPTSTISEIEKTHVSSLEEIHMSFSLKQSLFIFPVLFINQIQRKSDKDHTTEHISKCNRNKVCKAVKWCQCCNLFSCNSVSFFCFRNISRIK